VFLLNPASRPVWDSVPFLYRVQFPWRVMLFVTVAAAALAGCIVWRTRAWAALGVVALVVHVASWRPIPWKARFPSTPADMAGMWVAPDVAGEWLPRRARPLRGAEARCSRPCTVELIRRDAGRLGFTVQTDGEAVVTLPHYHFPVGWRATFDGRPTVLDVNEDGLMRVTVPGSGTIDLVFRTTSMKRRGAAVSGLVFLAWAFAGVLGARRRAAASSPDSDRVVARNGTGG
jgi:hypothetical protein